jgi:addiction module HigA family antidote
MNRLRNIHPGEILKEEFLKELGITAYRLSKETHIQQTRVSEILQGKRAITPDTALRFAKFFGTSPNFWIGLQTDYDIEEALRNKSSEIEAIRPFAESSENG